MSYNGFAGDVDRGLSAPNKYLSAKYFYDDRGSALFRQIMELPEYYLTRAELNIFQNRSAEIIAALEATNLRLIELGAGDGTKTIELLRHMLAAGIAVSYSPIDISAGAIEQLSKNVQHHLPALTIKPLVGDYFTTLQELPESSAKTLVLFLGANIGNYANPEAIDLLSRIGNTLNPGDMLLLGIDLKKDPGLIARAYDDAEGITREFNLNLLRRINRELKADFDLAKFTFRSNYNPENGEIRSYLVSLADQSVTIQACNNSYHFMAGEKIYTELSKKYDAAEISQLAVDSGFTCSYQFRDKDNYFADCLFVKQ